MAEEDFEIVKIREDFYRDSIGKVIAINLSIIAAIVISVLLFFYLYFNKPKPVTFSVDNEWRVQPSVPLNKAYLSIGDLLQWTGDTILKVFNFDYYHYDEQVKNASQYFTPDGWKIFLNQLNIYANYNNVQGNKQFINATPAAAPVLLQQGLLGGRYAWWVKLPITLNYIGNNQTYSRYLELQVLVVRVSNLTNLNGVGIDNVIVAKTSSS